MSHVTCHPKKAWSHPLLPGPKGVYLSAQNPLGACGHTGAITRAVGRSWQVVAGGRWQRFRGACVARFVPL